jgi:periplasmic protein TonB
VQNDIAGFVLHADAMRKRRDIMFTALIESRSIRSRNQFGTAGSAAVHLGLIVLAVYATAAGAPMLDEKDLPTKLRWIKTTVSQPTASRKSSDSHPSVTRAIPRLPQLSVSISAELPSVDIPLGAVRADEFPGPGIGTVTDGQPGPAGLSSDRPAYSATEVDAPVGALAGSGKPAYPTTMRTAGIEGEVVAQFIVDRNGHVSTESIRILSATNELFAESVKRAIPKMKFVAARLRSEPVPQTVQQLFSFRLDR